MDKYFYIAVPSEDFEEVKHTYYEAPSTYLRVYNSNRIDELEAELYAIQQQNKQMKEKMEWAARIIDSGMYGGALRYEPLLWFKEYHELIQGGSDNES